MHIGKFYLRIILQINPIEMTGSGCHRCNIELLSRRSFLFRLLFRFLLFCIGTVLAFNLGQKLVQFFDQLGGIAVCLLAILNLVQLSADKISHIQYMGHKLHMRNILGMRFSQVIKYILQLMRNLCNVVEHHNCG